MLEFIASCVVIYLLLAFVTASPVLSFVSKCLLCIAFIVIGCHFIMTSISSIPTGIGVFLFVLAVIPSLLIGIIFTALRRWYFTSHPDKA